LQTLFGKGEPQLLFDVMLHVGTLVAIGVVFKDDLARLLRAATSFVVPGNAGEPADTRTLWAILAGSIPTALIAVSFSEQFERLFGSITAAGGGLLMTGLILICTAFRGKPHDGKGDGDGVSRDVGIGRALAIGVAQGLAIFPGVSRSGATIAVALLLGVERETAARFSFLLAVPAVLGALVFELKDYQFGGAAASETTGASAMLAGALVAAVTGIVALKLLLGVVRRGKISLFAYYCWGLGLLAIGYGIIKG
jgi:undecaprenyl-diphosphatase